jgi:hypothetical protein
MKVFEITEGKGEDMLAKADDLLQGTGFARKGFEIVKATQQGSVRGSITDEALAMVKNMLAKAKAMGATEPAAVKPIMNPADVDNSEFESIQEMTASAVATAYAGGGNGFVNGGPGTIQRVTNKPKKKKKQSKNA